MKKYPKIILESTNNGEEVKLQKQEMWDTEPEIVMTIDGEEYRLKSDELLEAIEYLKYI